MKNSRLFIFSFLFIIGLFFIGTSPAHASIMDADAQRGASIQPFSTTDLATPEARKAMDTLRSTGANYVTLIIPYYQNNRQSTAMYPSWNTPTDATLIQAIDYAHSIGLKVMLKPHLETDYIEWRGNIETPQADRPKWYASYTAMLTHYGQIAQAHGVEDYCIGTEILKMASPDYNSGNTAEWKKMIAAVRQVFHGKMTYSANWYGELDRIGFWNDLDYIGISAYYDLYHAQNSSPVELKKSWDGWRSGIVEPIARQYGKPIVFTELGYRSIVNAHRDPWDWSRGGTYNEQDQANAYIALFEYWNAYPWMKGVELWRWDIYPPGANSGNIDYTPQNKLAQQIMKQYWGGTGTGTGNSGTGTTTNNESPVTGTSWTASANIFPNAPVAGNNVSITATVKNQSSVNVPSSVVDFEIYNPAGQQVFQKFFEAQTFAGNQQKSYNVNWTAGSNGNYTFKIGVFNPSWSHNYYWADAAVAIGVGTGGTSGTGTTTENIPPAETALDIWWPGQGVTVQGVQPFKAILTNRDIAGYNMYWQVDGDRMNDMGNSTEEYPHKESLVDLSGWNWKQTGSYNINFVAKDFSGTVIKEKAVNINVVP